MAIIYNQDELSNVKTLEDYVLNNCFVIVKSNDDDVIAFTANKRFVMIGLKENVEKLYKKIKNINDDSEFLLINIDNISVSNGGISCSISNINQYMPPWNFDAIGCILDYSINIDNHASFKRIDLCEFNKTITDSVYNYLKTGIGNSDDIINEIKLNLFDIYNKCGPVKNKSGFEIMTLLRKIKPIHIETINLFDLEIKHNIKNGFVSYEPTLLELSALVAINENAVRNTEFVKFYKNISVLFFKLYNSKKLIKIGDKKDGELITFIVTSVGLNVETYPDKCEFGKIRIHSIRIHDNIFLSKKQNYVDINDTYVFFLKVRSKLSFINMLQEQILSNI